MFHSGLTQQEVEQSRRKYGSNSLYIRPRRGLLRLLREVFSDPMFLLLLVACALYFTLGDLTEAWMMVGGVLFVVAIEIVQEYRSETALEALRQYAQPRVRVIREGRRQEIPAEEVVVGDLLVFEEGERLAADGVLIQQNDLSIDEAVLTGESLPVDKSLDEGRNKVFQGTTVSSGMGIAWVEAVGAGTAFGKLGKSIESIESEPTPLQRQINRFVRQMMWAGLLAFILVFGINLDHERSWMSALLFSLSLVMALVPAEIPVAFTAFMAIGAYRMTRQGVLVKQPKTVESLGSATVICLDKTGTITENRMSVAQLDDFSGRNRVLEYAMWASEPEPFDVMEKAIHQAWVERAERDIRPDFHLAYEYPLGGVPPMMSHVQTDVAGNRIIAAKGAVERVVRVCRLSPTQSEPVMARTIELAAKGYRVLGVASAVWQGEEFPAGQDDFDWQFEGLVALFDPPKHNIRSVIEQFNQAGIRVKMITGDYPQTAMNIATESGIRHDGTALSGEAVMQMSEEELSKAATHTNIFARMFPDAKLRVINALQSNGEVVAMTGDGVNDGPALKAAQIGVAMGRRGTEIAKGAASMVLLDDDLERMVAAIQNGRRIYHNLHKAIRYVISIHIPIVLTVLLPLVFHWPFLHILTPIHVVFLELIMDPTCAIAYENEPAEAGILKRPPRAAQSSLFAWHELSLSIFQGLAITAGVFGMYHYAVAQGHDETGVRSFVFLTLMLSNILLTLVNRSFGQSLLQTLRTPNRALWYIIGITLILTLAIFSIPALGGLFRIAPIHAADWVACILTSIVCVTWADLVKKAPHSTS
jgi:Ca2+-transporting ATPase